jgi:hypothetical protein
MGFQMIDFTSKILNTSISNNKEADIKRTFLQLTKRLKETGNFGACHLYSVYFYILLKEQGVESVMKIGYAALDGETHPFEHSWNEIDGLIYDIAIQWIMRLSNRHFPPVFSNIDMGTQKYAKSRYGLPNEYPDSLNKILQRTIGEFFNSFDEMGWNSIDNGWDEIIDVGNSLGLSLEKNYLKKKYNDHLRNK